MASKMSFSAEIEITCYGNGEIGMTMRDVPRGLDPDILLGAKFEQFASQDGANGRRDSHFVSYAAIPKRSQDAK